MTAKKRVKFEFDERSLKTLEQMTEEGYITQDGKMPPYREAELYGSGPSLSHMQFQLQVRDLEIRRLLDDNEKLQELADAVQSFKKAADDLRIKNAFNTATFRDFDAKTAAEKKLFEAFAEVQPVPLEDREGR